MYKYTNRDWLHNVKLINLLINMAVIFLILICDKLICMALVWECYNFLIFYFLAFYLVQIIKWSKLYTRLTAFIPLSDMERCKAILQSFKFQLIFSDFSNIKVISQKPFFNQYKFLPMLRQRWAIYRITNHAVLCLCSYYYYFFRITVLCTS